MTFKQITPEFFVSGQLTLDDLDEAIAQGVVVTAIPGPRSQELAARKGVTVPTELSMKHKALKEKLV